MATLARIALDGGGGLLIEATPGSVALEGPVKAGRLADAIHDLPETLQEALVPITEAVRATLDQLRKARPDEIVVGFGVDLAFEAGAVITKTGAGCHLNVTVAWKASAAARPGPDGSRG
ncbi:CU044_2847 family protein [Streptomyces sp. NPDC002209]|uniref:CU044_2847 family protein n=1 Tax=Streptomyces sp. NPDC002209 TaxID=3364638 RepID=UPI0036B6A0A5